MENALYTMDRSQVCSATLAFLFGSGDGLVVEGGTRIAAVCSHLLICGSRIFHVSAIRPHDS
jgi:hypothetical protein